MEKKGNDEGREEVKETFFPFIALRPVFQSAEFSERAEF